MRAQFNWDCLPNSRLGESYTGSVGCVLEAQKSKRCFFSGLKCLNLGCTAYFNKHCALDLAQKRWICCICDTKNNYNDDESQKFIDFADKEESVEFVSVLNQKSRSHPKVFIYVIDLHCEVEQEFNAMKNAIIDSIQNLPFHAVVQIVYDTVVSPVFDLTDADQLSRLQSLVLELRRHADSDAGQRPKRATGKILLRALDLVSRFNNHSSFPARILIFISGPCTVGPGKVVDLSLKSKFRSHQVVESFNEMTMVDGAASFYTGVASKAISLRKYSPIHASVRFDIFNASIDESGLFEMQNLCLQTGGSLIQVESFDTPDFRNNLLKSVEDKNWYNGVLEIKTSANWKICGVIGPVVSNKNHSKYASDVRIGESLSNTWTLNSINPNSGYAVYFQQSDLLRKKKSTKSCYYAQFSLSYYGDNEKITNILTVGLKSSDKADEIAANFNVDSYTTLLAKKVVFENLFNLKCDEQDFDSVLKNLVVHYGSFDDTDNDIAEIIAAVSDTSLTPNALDAASLRSLKVNNTTFKRFIAANNLIPLNSIFENVPELFYHLKNSYIANKFNITPDETSYYNNVLLQCNSEAGLRIIQPALYQLTRESVRRLPLDSNALNNSENILVLDQYFRILIHCGSTVAYYRDWFYKNINPSLRNKDPLNLDITEDIINPLEKILQLGSSLKAADYKLISSADFRQTFTLLKNAKIVATELAKGPERLISPSIVSADENKSQARFLYARLSPVDQYTQDYTSTIYTEARSLNSYYKQICQSPINVR